jgi:hypothetical protein
MTGRCMARNYDDCLRAVADTGAVYCPEPLCEKDWAAPDVAERLEVIRRHYPRETHPDVADLCDEVAGVLAVVAAHEAAAEGQPLGWAADIRNVFEGES